MKKISTLRIDSPDGRSDKHRLLFSSTDRTAKNVIADAIPSNDAVISFASQPKTAFDYGGGDFLALRRIAQDRWCVQIEPRSVSTAARHRMIRRANRQLRRRLLPTRDHHVIPKHSTRRRIRY